MNNSTSTPEFSVAGGASHVCMSVICSNMFEVFIPQSHIQQYRMRQCIFLNSNELFVKAAHDTISVQQSTQNFYLSQSEK